MRNQGGVAREVQGARFSRSSHARVCVCVWGQRPRRWDKQWRARRRPCSHCLLREEQRRRCGIVSSCLKLLDGGFWDRSAGRLDGPAAALVMLSCSSVRRRTNLHLCLSTHTHVHTHSTACLPAASSYSRQSVILVDRERVWLLGHLCFHAVL